MYNNPLGRLSGTPSNCPPSPLPNKDHPSPHHPSRLPVKRLRRPPVLWPHEIRHRLWLLVIVRRVAVLVVVVGVRVVGRANVLHAVDAAALGAAFDGAGAGHLSFFCEC